MPSCGQEKEGLPLSRVGFFPDDAVEGKRESCKCLPGKDCNSGPWDLDRHWRPEMIGSMNVGLNEAKCYSHGHLGPKKQKG